MPTLTRVLIRLAIAWLISGLLVWLGSACAPARLGGLFAPATHMITFGWLTQLVFGVAYWLFPKRKRHDGRGGERFGWLACATLNIGLVLRVAAEPISASWAGEALVVASALEFVAAVSFACMLRGRIRGK